jgi:predicted molibdopterin-dependent oxidoreductase YjgC
VAWAQAATTLADALGKVGNGAVACVASPFATNEDLWALRRFADEVLGGAPVAHEVTPQAESAAKGDDFLLKADRTPNRKGLETIFAGAVSFDRIREGILSGKIRALVVMENDLVRHSRQPDATRELLAKLEVLVSLSTNHDEVAELAQVTLPAATFLEKEATFTNFAGRVQRLKPAFAPLFESRPSWAILEFLAVAMGRPSFGWTTAPEVFADLAAKVEAFRGLDHAKVGEGGAMLAASAAPPLKHRAAHPLGAAG